MKKILLPLSVMIVLICLVAYCTRKDPTDIDNPVRTSEDIPKEYRHLFPAENVSLLVPFESSYFASRSPMSIISFDSNKYFIEIYKIGKIGKSPLNKMIIVTPNWSPVPTHMEFQTTDESLFDVWSRPFANELSQIYLNVHGDSLKFVAQSDSLVSVYFRFHDFSLKYNKADTVRIYAQAGHFTPGDDEYPRSTYPIILTFIRRNNSVYLLLMSVNDSATKLSPDLMYRLVAKKYDEKAQ